MSKAKAIGTNAETKLVKYLKGLGLDARRIAMASIHDKGDVEVLNFNDTNVCITFECKAGRQTENPKPSDIRKWTVETLEEILNYRTIEKKSAIGVLCIARYGKTISNWDFYVFDSNCNRIHCYANELLEILDLQCKQY